MWAKFRLCVLLRAGLVREHGKVKTRAIVDRKAEVSKISFGD